MSSDERDPDARIERILGPEYLQGLGELDSGELRRRRAECREEEELASFCRRLLHGKLDVLRNELEERRHRGEVTEREDIGEWLAPILGRGPGGSRGGRSRLPSAGLQAAGRERIERIVSETHLARLPELGTEELASIVERLVDEERRISEERRSLHAVIDTLDAELMRRYREGAASPTDVLGPRDER